MKIRIVARTIFFKTLYFKLNYLAEQNLMKSLQSLIAQSRRILSLPGKIAEKIIYSRSLPQNHVVEDVFLVSYPKSGNTWLRFLIANAIKVHYQINQEVNFFNILSIIPSPRGTTNLCHQGPFGRNDIPRIINSHSAYNPYYYRVIWLVRDPRDVMVSYYHYLRGLKQISDTTSMSEFIRHKKYGIKSWTAHGKSWYFNTNPSGYRVKIIRYEDFLEDTKAQLLLLMELFGIKMDDKSLEDAIMFSSRERMRDSEKKHLSMHFVNDKMSFVRKGIVTGGEELSDTDRKFIEDSTRDIAQILGYKF